MGIVKDSLYLISSKSLLTFFKKQPIFPYYHLIRDNKIAHIENLYSYKNMQQFKNDLDVLTANYHAIHPQELFQTKVRPNSFLLTFDDGLHEIYTHIYPVLKEKNIPAVFFINPDFVDNEQILYKHSISIIINRLKESPNKHSEMEALSKVIAISYKSEEEFFKKLKSVKFADRHIISEALALLQIDIRHYLQTQQPYISKLQIQEMIDAGFYFGGHTMSHPPLNQLSLEQQLAEIVDSVKWLKVHFNIDYSYFAFPFTDRGISKKLIDALFAYDPKMLLFGNSGIKKDVSSQIIQRFSLENPHKETIKQIVAENLYKYFNKLIGSYHIKRND